MTKERGEEVVLAAVVLSTAIHVGLMLLVRPQVMTHVVSDTVRSARHAPMSVTKAPPPPETVGVDAFADLVAAKDEPVAETAVPVAEAVADANAVRPPDAPQATAVETTPPTPSAPVFEVAAVKLAAKAAPPAPMTRIETPAASSAGGSAPSFSLAAAPLAPAAAPPTPASAASAAAAVAAMAPPPTAAAEKISRPESSSPPPTFVPAEEVYEKVDEKVVAAEKEAVKALVAADNAEELEKFVNVAMTTHAEGSWTYFRVLFSPRASLQVVPKDFVVLVDASGSIGKDRMASIRGAARRILRSATNSGDRFNFVAFRDRFSYAFRTWQECTQPSFDAADAWLGKLAAHGRTDVFATISSVLTLPRDPTRPLIALVVTDGDANEGVSDTAEILSKFTALNDGLVSVYMYGVRSSANRELIEVLTRGNRGESAIYDGWRRAAGSGIDALTERFRDPVLTDLRVVFASGTRAEMLPRRLRNLYRGGTLSFLGRVPKGTERVAFSLRGLNGKKAFEGFFELPLAVAGKDDGIVRDWQSELVVDAKLK